MRDDYYSLSDLERLLHSTNVIVRDKVMKLEGFPLAYTGTRYIVDKERLLIWLRRNELAMLTVVTKQQLDNILNDLKKHFGRKRNGKSSPATSSYAEKAKLEKANRRRKTPYAYEKRHSSGGCL